MRSLLVLTLALSVPACRSPEARYREAVQNASISSQLTRQLSASLTSEPAADAPRDSYLIESLVQLGLSNNPALKSARHNIQALRYQIPAELSLPDPMVSTTTHLAPIETAAGRQAFALGISQQIVDGDRRATQAAVVHDEIKAARAKLKSQEHLLAANIRVACIQLLESREAIELVNQDLESLAGLEEVVLTQYESQQDTSQQDVLDIQAERSRGETSLARWTASKTDEGLHGVHKGGKRRNPHPGSGHLPCIRGHTRIEGATG